MTSPNIFANARVESYGSARGGDELRHDVFKIERVDGPALYGDYFYVFPNDGSNFNIEIGVFGYVDPYNVGNLHPAAREYFSTEESHLVEQLVRSFFLSKPIIFAKRWGSPERFLGGVGFRPNWIIQRTLGEGPTAPNVAAAGSWYGTLTRTQWKTLAAAANLGWMFDGYETFALILTVGVALRQLLEPARFPQIPAYAGTVIAVTLLGWGIGGILGGILADYIGRRRTMIYAILAYSLITGLSALAFDWMSFALLRFLVGIAIGSEWSTGASITAEVWPDHARGKGAGLMQCGLGIGFFLASLIWLYVGALGPGAWRFMYVIGVLPALFVLWIRTGIPESEPWERTNESRRLAHARQQGGASLSPDEQALTRFTLTDLFVDPQNRARALLVFLLSLTTTLAWWGISTWVPPYIGSVAAKAGLPAQQWASYAGMTYNLGAILGYASFGFLADRFGRKGVTMLFFALALLLTPVLFLWTHDLGLLLLVAAVNGYFSLGQYSWMPVWLPELFPTRIRATAMAFAFNAPRFIAFLGPLLAGNLIVYFGGFGTAATIVATIYLLGLAAAPFLPETRGKPLPA